MVSAMWKVRLDAVRDAAVRDASDMARQTRQFIAGLDTSERLVLLGLGLIGALYLLLNHFQGRDEGEPANGRFVGLMFVMTAIAAGFGWTISGHNA